MARAPQAPEFAPIAEELFGRVGDFYWQEKAACAKSELDFILPTYNSERALAALAICETCSVRDDCLKTALLHNETDGIWGGTTPKERRTLVAKRLNAYKEAHSRDA